MEHPGTFLNIPKHRIITIIMRKICKLVSARNIKDILEGRGVGGGGVAGLLGIPSTDHNECQLRHVALQHSVSQHKHERFV